MKCALFERSTKGNHRNDSTHDRPTPTAADEGDAEPDERAGEHERSGPSAARVAEQDPGHERDEQPERDLHTDAFTPTPTV